ncbi:MAG: T9SS type A sorting domain-containing protein [Bacteroides sp.]|nr:T9SS type A sorting domain-containing protein [Bacteroides sp.]
MKLNHLLTLAILISGISLFAQNPPSIGTPENDTLYLGTGQNFLLIPNVDDGDPGLDQEITFTVISSDPAILEINDVVYTAGQTMAIIHATEKQVSGTVTIEVEAADPDGTASTSFEVFVGPYSNPGINFEIHDIIFWQQFVPLKSNPAFSMIAPDGVAPYEEIDLAGLKLSVYSDCKDSPPCTGTDFFTAMFKGYVVPPTSGSYSFYMIAGDQKSIGLSSDEDFDHTEVILHSAEGIGSSSGNKEWKSVDVSLVAGNTYAIYGTHWNIHTLMGGMLWEGPGIEKEYIPGQYLSHVYDVVKPSVPADFSLINTGINDLMLRWSAATDDRGLDGYNVYLNGIQINEKPIKETVYQVEELIAGTDYCLVVTSVDLAGNESAESEIICTTTYESDDIAPNPPTSIEALVISDLSMKISWSGASDGETEIRGYNLYVDGVLYNTIDLIYDEELVVLGLSPETDYQFELEAVDAAYNISIKSDPVTFTSNAFDPNDTSIDDKKGRLKVLMDPIGRSDGIGVNANYKNGEFLNDPQQVKLIKELEVAAMRWGALTANPLNFEDYIGAGKAMTFGRFMDFCNEINAYTVISCGVEDATDWRKDPATFTNFLEYLAGPSSSTYGAKRAEEGYAESLLEGSRGLVFEFGNEVWGGDSHDAQIGKNYVEYGNWCREMATLMRGSDYYNEDKIFLTYSGRNPHPDDYSRTLHENLLNGDAGEVDWLAVSGYMGGNLDYSPEIDPGESELDYYRNGLSSMLRNIEGLKLTMEIVLQSSGDFKPTYMYEANMTNSSYYGRLGQALVQTDYYASVVETGSALPTVFHLTGGQWKMLVPSQDYKKLPLFYTTKYYNKLCKGNALRTEFETSRPGIETVGCHVYSEGDAFGVLLISRDFENDWTVQVDLPDELELMAPETVKMYTITGDGFSSKEAHVDSTLINMSDSLLLTVPKHSMVVFGFEGSGVSVEDVPLGFYDYASAESVNIYALGGIEVFEIDGRSKLVFKAEVMPEDILSDAVIWSVESDGVEAIYSVMSYGFDLKGSGTCAGNGTIKVRATAWDNPEIYDEVEVTISGQGTDCGVGLNDPEGTGLKIYPNPARELLHVDGLSQGVVLLEVTDITGRICLLQDCANAQADIDLSGFEAGVYYLRISGSDAIIIRPFVVK